jgi:NAD(P)-dependent dehydrogenase (short-subunit alcohol dehydrogenase family)
VDLGLRDRVAIVTGGSRGIGRQVALDLAEEGCHVLLCGRDTAALADVAAEVEARGARAVAMEADVTAASTAAAIVEACLRSFGRIDVLVNNAGSSRPRRLEDVTADDWQAEFEVNFFGAARLAVACAPVMRDAGWGRFVHVASINARSPDPLFAPYSAAKAALISLSGSLAQAYSAHGVLSSCVIPGVVMTELVRSTTAATAERSGITSEEVMAKLMARQRVPAKRFGEPNEVSAAIVFLASEQASWITGATLTIDGGTLRTS